MVKKNLRRRWPIAPSEVVMHRNLKLMLTYARGGGILQIIRVGQFTSPFFGWTPSAGSIGKQVFASRRLRTALATAISKSKSVNIRGKYLARSCLEGEDRRGRVRWIGRRSADRAVKLPGLCQNVTPVVTRSQIVSSIFPGRGRKVIFGSSGPARRGPGRRRPGRGTPYRVQ